MAVWSNPLILLDFSTINFWLRGLSFCENIEIDIPARNIPKVAIKYPIIKSDPNHLLKISEYSPTNLGPKIDPNTENQTARDKAVALKLSDATKDAAYLV